MTLIPLRISGSMAMAAQVFNTCVMLPVGSGSTAETAQLRSLTESFFRQQEKDIFSVYQLLEQGAALASQEKPTEAVENYLKAAVDVSRKIDLASAARLYSRALAGRICILGRNHFDTLVSFGELGTCWPSMIRDPSWIMGFYLREPPVSYFLVAVWPFEEWLPLKYTLSIGSSHRRLARYWYSTRRPTCYRKSQEKGLIVPIRYSSQKVFVEQLQQLHLFEDTAGQVASYSGDPTYDHRLDSRRHAVHSPRSPTSTTISSPPSRSAQGPTG